MSRTFKVADMFCGAGGSSTGARRALERIGHTMRLVAINHWPVAIETHSRNHPDAEHYCCDVYRTKPRDVVPGGKLDLLMASPTCTFHSRARGGKPISHEQRYGRMTPTQVLRWITELDVKRLLVENVPEFVQWGVVHPTGWRARKDHPCRIAGCRADKPCVRRRGCYFRGWVRRIEALGYKVEWRVLNAADFGDATTRQRFFLMARKDGKPITWPEPTHSRDGGLGLFGRREKWRAAREIIDWSLPGRSIFDRPRPLAQKTLARILAGAKRFGWPEPFLVILRQHMDAASIDGPLPTITAGGTHVGVAEQTLTPFTLAQAAGGVARDVEDPVATIATRGAVSLTEPVLVTVTGGDKPKPPRTSADPLPTITTKNGVGIARPLLAPYYGQGSGTTAKSVDQPLDTVTTKERFALATAVAQPFMLPQHSDGNGKPRTCDIENPVPTVTTVARIGVAEPCLLDVSHGNAARERDPNARRVRSLGAPLPTVTASGGQFGVAEPFIVPQFGEAPGQTPRSHAVGEPLPAVTSHGAGAIVEPVAGDRVVLVDGVPHRMDIRFRMLEPYELARAMGFSDDESEYEFVGNKTEITKQIGNAVPVRTATALVAALFEDAKAARKRAVEGGAA